MLEKDYISKIKDEKIKKPMLKISNFFEPYIGNDHDDKSKIFFEKNNIDEYYQRLEKNNIKQEISSLRKEVSQKEYSVLNSFVLSLQRNTNQFIKDEKYRTSRKIKKMIYSYLNVSRMTQNLEEIEAVRKGDDVDTKVILSLSLVNLEEDNIKANEEVDNISQIMESNTNYVVLPIQGCTTTLFITIFKKFSHIDIIHIAGHTDNSRRNVMLKFVDSNMGFEAFKRATHSHQFSLAVLNCCSTFEFALGNKIPNASTCILHQDLVLRDVAYNFMECFFQTFEHTEDVHPSWEYAVQNSNENPLRYYCILPNLNS